MATVPNWEEIGKGQPKLILSGSQWRAFQTNAQVPGTRENKIVQVFGSPEAYRSTVQQYDLAYKQYLADFYAEQADAAEKNPTYTESGRASAKATAEKAAQAVIDFEEKQKAAVQAEKDAYAQNLSNLRTQLETQYNNLVSADSRFGYAGRNADLNAVFNQQAAQLASAGVTNIGNLRIKDGSLIDSSTGKVVNTSNLGGQVYTDRDTGVQKWGDIFSGVQGGANYGIMQAPDGSVVLFPAWEKTKSLAAQIGGETLEKYIVPILTVAGAYFGVPGLGAVGGAAAGAAAGNTVGQVLATGKVDWEKVAVSAAGAGAGQYVSGLLSPEAAAAGGATEVAPDLTGTTGGMTGADYGFNVATGTPAYDLLGTVDLSKLGAYGETGISAIGSTSPDLASAIGTAAPGAGTGIQVLGPASAGGAATIAGLEAPGLISMGGAQGLTVPIQGGGVISEMGFIPVGATPSLGDPSSFINNPDYLGSPVISEDYVGLSGADMPSGPMNIKDVLGMARTGMQLFGGQQPGLLGGGYGGGGGRQAAGVDYSGLLALLQGKAGVPGVSPLLSPVVSPLAQQQNLLNAPMPQYQPLSLNLLG